MKMQGELFEMYFLMKKDEAELAALMAEKRGRMSEEQIREKYAHMIRLHAQEKRMFWDVACSTYDLDRSQEYIVTRAGEIIPVLDMEAASA